MPNNTVYAMQNAIGNTNGTTNQTSGPTVTAASTKEDNSAVKGFSNANNWKGDTSPGALQSEAFCKNQAHYCIPPLCVPMINVLCTLIDECRVNIDLMREAEAYRDQQIKLWNAECSEFLKIVDGGGNGTTIGVITKGGLLPLPLLTKCNGYAQDIYDSSIPGWSKPWKPNGKKPFPISGGPDTNDGRWTYAQYCYGNNGGSGNIGQQSKAVRTCLKPLNPINPL